MQSPDHQTLAHSPVHILSLAEQRSALQYDPRNIISSHLLHWLVFTS